MKSPISLLPPFAPGKNIVHAVIETPRFSNVKYSYDPKRGLMRAKKALPMGMMFPFNFGFVPSTKGEDGDPLDILVLNREPLVPGCYILARLIGVIEAKQTQEGKTTRNDRLIGAPAAVESEKDFEQIELNREIEKDIERFFVAYNQLQGKKFVVTGRRGPNRARDLIHQGVKRAGN